MNISLLSACAFQFSFLVRFFLQSTLTESLAQARSEAILGHEIFAFSVRKEVSEIWKLSKVTDFPKLVIHKFEVLQNQSKIKSILYLNKTSTENLFATQAVQF